MHEHRQGSYITRIVGGKLMNEYQARLGEHRVKKTTFQGELSSGNLVQDIRAQKFQNREMCKLDEDLLTIFRVFGITVRGQET